MCQNSENPPSKQPTSHLRILKMCARWIVALVLTGLIVRMLIHYWDYQTWKSTNVDWWMILGAGVTLMFYFPALAVGWWLIMRAMGLHMPLVNACRYWLVSLAGKYLPGRVGLVLGRMYCCRKEDIPQRLILVSIIFEVLILNLTGFMLSLLVFISLNVDNKMRLLLELLPVVILGAIVCHPGVFHRLANLAMRLAHRESIETRLTGRRLAAIIAYYLAVALLSMLSFFLCCKSVAPTPWSLFPFLGGTIFSAVMIGVFSALTPGALGVREGALYFLLSMVYPKPIAILIPFVSRGLDTLCEALLIAVALLLRPQIGQEPKIEE